MSIKHNKNKIILDLCGGSGAWSEPYSATGYDVRVITLPARDVRTYKPPAGVHGIIAAPPCEQFSFARSNTKIPVDFRKGMEIVQACLNIIWECTYDAWEKHEIKRLKFWALENPNGYLIRFLGYPVMEFHPWHFGDPYTKRTCLWGRFNPPRINSVTENVVSFGKHTNETKDRAKRAITPAGFAKAFFEANK